MKFKLQNMENNKWRFFRDFPFEMKMICFSVLLIFVTSSGVFAQKSTITGTITSSTDKLPIPGVNILIKGTLDGTITDTDGKYTLNAAPTDVLVVSFIGYETQEITVGEQTKFSVILKEDITSLKEVVVVGYGTMKKTDMSSAQVSVSAEDIEKTQATTLEEALQGRAAGVYVSQNSGQPGGGVSVAIRGISSINATTEPLYVIDGVQIVVDNKTSVNPLAGINPDDIETLSILQGPSATSIYGSRASNGVIIITTKRGKSGVTKVSYNTTLGIQALPKFIDVMNLQEYARFSNSQNEVTGATPNPYYLDPSVLGEGTNWQDELFQPAFSQKHQLSLTGGSENSSFYLSAGYFDSDGIAAGSGFNRYSVRLNMDNQTRKWLKIGTSISLNQTRDELTFEGDDSGRLVLMAIQQSPAIPVQNPDGSWGGPASTQYQISNPVALAAINENYMKRRAALGNIYADIDILKGLTFHTELSGNFSYRNSYKYEPGYEFGGYVKDQKNSKSWRYSSNDLYWNFNTRLNYHKVFLEKHDVSVLIAHEAQETKNEALEGSRTGFITNTIHEIRAGDAATASSTSSAGDWSQDSYFGRVNYVLAGKYILMGTFRADGSPTFAESKRWGYFPSVSAAWKISDESFMSALPKINALKLRLEYGVTGNQTAEGATYYAALLSIPSPWGTGFMTENYSNPDFQWEETVASNIGFDLYMFKNRVEFIFDAYNKNTSNLIMWVTLPDYMGTHGENNGSIRRPWANVGDMNNKGFAIMLNTVNIEGDFSWKTGFTFSLNRNELTDIYSVSNPPTNEAWFLPDFQSRSEIGESVGQFYGYEKAGLFTSVEEIESSAIPEGNVIDEVSGTWVGDNKYVDQITVDTDGDGVADARDGVINGQDKVLIGRPSPDFDFGLSNTFSYKNFDLSFAFVGVYGNEIFNWVRFKNENPDYSASGSNYLTSAADFARLAEDQSGIVYIENEGTQIPRITLGDPNGNGRITDQYVEDGSFIRLKTVQLTYNFPGSLTEKLHISGLKMTLAAQNLLTFSKYSGQDPEVGQFKDERVANPMPGIDYGRYPTSKAYSFSLQVNF